MKNYAIENLRIKNGNNFVLPNIRFNKTNMPCIKSINDEKIRFVHVANIFRNKNFEFALSLISKISKSRNVSLTIYGAVVDKEYFKELKKSLMRKKLKK